MVVVALVMVSSKTCRRLLADDIVVVLLDGIESFQSSIVVVLLDGIESLRSSILLLRTPESNSVVGRFVVVACPTHENAEISQTISPAAMK
jgi:hypothetical protein